MSFVHKNYKGSEYNRALQNIYKVNVYGYTDCAQIVQHHDFATPEYESIRLLKCSGTTIEHGNWP